MTKRNRSDELYTLAQDIISDYSERDALYDELDDYYFLEDTKEAREVSDEEGVEKVRLPLGPNAIDLVQDLLGSADWTLTVPAADNKETKKKLADQSEKYLRSVWQESEKQQNVRLLPRAAWLAAMRGCLCGRVMPRVVKGKKGDERLQIQLRDPRYVYPRFGSDGLTCVVESWQRSVHDVRQSVGDDKVLPDMEDTDEVTWVEYWDEGRFCYWADGMAIKAKGKAKNGIIPHLYGGIPYVWAFARETGMSEPEKRVRPLLASMRNLIDRMDMLASQEATFVGRYAGDAWIAFSDEMASQDADAEYKRRVDLSPGAVNYFRETEKFQPIYGGRAQPELQEAMARYRQEFERGTFPGTMFGEDPGRMVAGYAISLLNQTGQMRLRPMRACIEAWIAGLFRTALMISELYLVPVVGKVPFYWYAKEQDESGEEAEVRSELELDAKALEGSWEVEVKLGDVMPQDEQANLAMAQMSVKDGLMSWETSVQKYGIVDDATRERERLDREMAMADPEIQALRVAIAKARIREELRQEAAKLDIDVDAVLSVPQVGQQPMGMPGMPPGQPSGLPWMPGPGPTATPGMMQPGSVPGAPMGAPPAQLPIEALMPPGPQQIPGMPAAPPGPPPGLSQEELAALMAGKLPPGIPNMGGM